MDMRKTGESARMVQFCPKCGTKAPDDESVFCNKCGTRLPPVIPEKTDTFCHKCGAKAPDEQSLFCNKCGSQLYPARPVPVQQAGALPAAARPVMSGKRCPSCGATLADEDADRCDLCGMYLRAPDPLRTGAQTMPEDDQPLVETPVSAPLVADRPVDGSGTPVKKKNWRSFAVPGLMALAAIILLIIIAGFIAGMAPGTNQSSSIPPAPTLHDQNSITVPPTKRTTQTTAPVLTTSPAKKTTKPVLTTVTTNASATAKTNVSTTRTSNASETATPTPFPTVPAQPLSIGQSASDGKGKLTVNSIAFKEKMSDPTPSYAIGKLYLVVEITYENLLKNGTVNVDPRGMVVKDGGGFVFEPASDVLLENPFNGETVPSQEKRTGTMLFIVPPEATFLKFQYDFGNQNIATFQLT